MILYKIAVKVTCLCKRPVSNVAGVMHFVIAQHRSFVQLCFRRAPIKKSCTALVGHFPPVCFWIGSMSDYLLEGSFDARVKLFVTCRSTYESASVCHRCKHLSIH